VHGDEPHEVGQGVGVVQHGVRVAGGVCVRAGLGRHRGGAGEQQRDGGDGERLCGPEACRTAPSVIRGAPAATALAATAAGSAAVEPGAEREISGNEADTADDQIVNPTGLLRAKAEQPQRSGRDPRGCCHHQGLHVVLSCG